MVAKVVSHERCNEIVAVVVTIVAAQFERDPFCVARSCKQVWMQFLFEKLIGKALVDQDGVCGQRCQPFDEFRRIVI